MSQSHALVSLAGRFLLSLIFIVSGLQKLTGYDATLAYMQAFGVPGMLLPLVILAELGCGVAILVGILSRWAALALAAFSVVAGIIFHSDLGDPMQTVMLMKNFAMAGGLLLLYANGPGAYALRD